MNWHICHKRKLLFLFIFSTYLIVFLLKFRSRELVGCGIKFYIQRVPLKILLMDPTTPKTRNTWKNVMMTSSSRFFQVFLIFGVAGSIKSMLSGYSLDAEFNSTSNEISRLKFEEKYGEICRKYRQKNSFYFSSSKINKYYFIILTIILLVHFRRPILSWNFL